MVRPTKPRWIEFYPNVTYFKPAGSPMSDLEEISLGVDEFEALRLKDSVGLEQEECAVRMNLAQSTFQRILAQARSKVASALVQGNAIRIEGGNYVVSPRGFVCRHCRHEWESQDSAADDLSPTCPVCGNQTVDVFRKVPLEPPYGPARRGMGGQGRRGRGGGGRQGGPRRGSPP